MLKSHLRTAWRSLTKNKAHSTINIVGLAVGMAVTMLIGFWIYDEVSFDKSVPQHGRIGQVWQNVTFDKETGTYNVLPQPLSDVLRTKYPQFKYVSLAAEDQNVVLTIGDKKLSENGSYVQPDFAEMLSLPMLAGTRSSIKEVHSILLSQSLAKALFGSDDPLGKVLAINNKLAVTITGVYQDFPDNSTFKAVRFLAPWDLYASDQQWVRDSKTTWDNNSWQIYVELKPGADFGRVSALIKDIRVNLPDPPPYKPAFFIHPMDRWHLYSDFKNGVNIGGLIGFVWLFGIIGIFVLLLACINFMNLSTARSEKRAREVGIRKTVGSVRGQLILQFLSESLLVVAAAFVLSLLLVQISLPLFNDISGKKMTILWSNPLFWVLGISFCLITGLVAGSYPAIYLSSFKPIKVLKGTFKAGRLASLPRKVLVVLQFTVSVALIIGTIVVFRQIQYAKDRPIGYSRSGLIEVNMNTPELAGHLEAIRTDLLRTGSVSAFAASSCSLSGQNGGTTNSTWEGKDPNMHPLLMRNVVSTDFGKAVGWDLVAGRDFSKEFLTDSAAMIINEAYVKLAGFKNPIGQTITFGGAPYKVIGVVKDMIRENPFIPVKPTFFIYGHDLNTIHIKLSPTLGTREALEKVGSVFNKYNPSSPFSFTFVNEQYARKFENEERIGKLASVFAILAIFISCLGLFGLASFVAEQRTKEIGVRKVLGASVLHVWQLLSREFILLVVISLFIAMPVAYYFMQRWLQNYDYHTTASWWIFAATGAGAVLITILTVSFQAIKAALMNPVRSLRTE
jgi:putative ABC transport system permease protein